MYTGPAAKVCKCDLARNYNGLSALCSFEQGITMVCANAKVSWCDFARNYDGFGAIAGIHVRLSQELQWFALPPKESCAILPGITTVLEPSQVSMFV